MKAPAKFTTIILALAATVVLVGAVNRQTTSATRWEYRYESSGRLTDTTRLNAWGREGWELVSVTFLGNVNMTTGLYFKRPLP